MADIVGDIIRMMVGTVSDRVHLMYKCEYINIMMFTYSFTELSACTKIGNRNNDNA